MKPIALRDAHEEFKNYLKTNQKSNSTVIAYGKDIEQLIFFLNELQRNHIHEVTKEDLDAFLAKLTNQGYTPKSVSRKLNSTRTFYRFLKVSEYITDDPSLLVAHPKYELNPPRVLSPLEYRALRDSASSDARIYAIVEVLLQTGVRIGELANIRNEDVKDGVLAVRPYEGHPMREVPLNKRAKDALKRYRDIRPITT